MAIRPATNEDFADLQRLNQQIFVHEIEHCQPAGWNANFPYEQSGVEYLKKAINNIDGFHAFVFEEADENIGYMILYKIPENMTSHRTAIKLAQLHTFCVDSGHRGSGIGTEMIAYAKKWGKAQGATHFKVVACAKNKDAISIYKKCGFEEFETAFEVSL